MVCDAVQERSGHFGAPEDGAPFFELEIGCEDDGRGFVEFPDEVEKQPAAGFGEWNISQLVHDDAICTHELFFDAACLAIAFFFDEKIKACFVQSETGERCLSLWSNAFPVTF